MKKFFLSVLIVFLLSISIAHAGITGFSNANIQEDTIFGSSAKKMWVLNWNALSTDEISGTLTQSELQAQTGVQPKQTFSVRMSSGDEYATYKFISAGYNPVKTYEFIFHEEHNWNPIGDVTQKLTEWGNANCADYDNDGTKESIRKLPSYPLKNYGVIFCTKESAQLGNVAGISSPTSIFNTNWELKAEGKNPEKITLSNDQNVQAGTSSKLGNNVEIKWQGSLSTGAPAQQPLEILGLHSNNIPNGWKLIDSSNYAVWKGYVFGAGIDSCLRDFSDSKVSAAFCTGQVKQRAETAVRGASNVNFLSPVILDATFSNGKMKIDLPERVSIPSYQVFVNADYLELVIPVGEPKIVSVSIDKFSEKTVGTVKAIVQNVGKGRGDFEAKIFGCTKDAEADSVTQTFELDPAQTTTLTFRLSATSISTTEKEISGTCTFAMKERTTQKEVTSSFQYTFVQENECTPGNERATIEGGVSVVKKCDANGLTETTTLVCKQGETATFRDTGYVCGTNKPPPPPPPCDPDKEKCDQKNLYQLCVEGRLAERGLLTKLNPLSLEPIKIKISCAWDVYKANLVVGFIVGVLLLLVLLIGKTTRMLIASSGILGAIISLGIIGLMMFLATISLVFAVLMFGIAILILIGVVFFKGFAFMR